MDITFKQFNWKEDLQDILKWHKDMVKIDFPDSRYKRLLFQRILQKEYKEGPEGMMILMDESQKIGFLWLNIRYDPYRERKYGYVHYLYLIPRYRNRGLGQKLIKKTEEYFFKRKKLNIIQLGTGTHNIPALKLYKKMGYKPRRMILEKYKE